MGDVAYHSNQSTPSALLTNHITAGTKYLSLFHQSDHLFKIIDQAYYCGRETTIYLYHQSDQITLQRCWPIIFLGARNTFLSSTNQVKCIDQSYCCRCEVTLSSTNQTNPSISWPIIAAGTKQLNLFQQSDHPFHNVDQSYCCGRETPFSPPRMRPRCQNVRPIRNFGHEVYFSLPPVRAPNVVDQL